jgi:ketosteroid isomerase-like protein
MSQENVEIVRLLYEAVNRGDLDVVLEFLDPSIHLDFSERVFNPAIYEGHDGARRFYAELDEVWDDFRTEPVEFIEAGETGSSSFTAYRESARSAVSRSSCQAQASTQSAVARSSRFGCIGSIAMPSKPPGCGMQAASRPRALVFKVAVGQLTELRRLRSREI